MKVATKVQKANIKNHTRAELEAWLEKLNWKKYIAQQIFLWLYIKNVDSFDEMTNISKEKRELLSQHFDIARLKVLKEKTSKDGSRKYLFELKDRNNIETVLLPQSKGYTICISSQVGCKQNCKFCLTSKSSFVRSLETGEIISQISDIMRYNQDIKITNVVFMGMGEPFDNYENVLKSISIITDTDYGFKISNYKTSVSTVGILPKIKQFCQESQANLAISLNSLNNKTRNQIMPTNKEYPIDSIIKACKTFPFKRQKNITFEYIMIKDLNDKQEDLKALIQNFQNTRFKINLIPFNEHPLSDFKTSDKTKIDFFWQELNNKNIMTTIRKSLGQDILAACGQLRYQIDKKRALHNVLFC